ncbi:DUF421 domain-containing protein [Alkaliphilus transvaalensis]|uniref:DUF421 domain-containing protein n=1 Tax=Alkaliphilus transvaalensis TaxID=114628 RepID=UPI00047EE18C|nr:DUF421 domain-containing protein [Alkaliphilus transvaalensis]
MEAWLNIALRTIALFLALILISPIMGRKSVSSMTYFDVVAAIVLGVMGALVALGVIESVRLGFTGIALWFLAIGALQFFIQKSKWAHDHFYGKEVVVIKEGKVLEENLHSAGLTGEELLSQLRRKNVFALADVEFAVMEANRDITVMPKREKQPLTPKDMRIQVSSIKEPQTVMLDGKILDEPLASLGLNKGWLRTELKKIGVAEEQIFLAQVDSMGELYVDVFSDSLLLPQPSTKDLLMATLEKLEADFITYSTDTENPTWQRKYVQFAKDIKVIKKKLEPHLKT